jgi:hypothetical protein
MLDFLHSAFHDDALDLFFGLTCDVPFVRMSVREGVCPVCGSRLDSSPKAVRSLKVACSGEACGFVLRARGRMTATEN